MDKLVDIDATRVRFETAISTVLPKSACVKVRAGASSEAIAFQCTWPLDGSDPNHVTYAREIVVLLNVAAINRYRAASARARSRMLAKFTEMLRKQLADGRYDARRSSGSPFIAHINDADLVP